MAPRRYDKPTPGVRTWHSRDALTRAKKWAGGIALGLFVLALLWLSGLADDEGIDGDLILGVVMLELFTLIPAAYAANRWRALRALLRHADTIDAGELEAEAASLEAADEVRWSVGRLVDTLAPGAARDAGLAGLRAAEQAAVTRQLIFRRSAELERLRGVT
jgi:hypothetical protein